MSEGKRKQFVVTVCPGCGKRLSVNGVDIHKKPESKK